MITGVYRIRNLITSDIYIGSTRVSFSARKYQHFRRLKKNKHDSPILQNSWNKHKEKNFVFEIIEMCLPDDCLKREQYYIDTLNPRYNICKIAGSRKNIVVSEETRKKLSIAKTGFKHSEETKRKLSISHKGLNTWTKGRKLSKEHCLKISKANTGRKFPQRQGIPSWNKGKPFNDQAKHKMSLAKKGKLWSKQKKENHRLLLSKYRPQIIRNDGQIYKNITEAAKELKVKENTIVKSISDKKVNRKVKGYKFRYYKEESIKKTVEEFEKKGKKK